jgi:hypothetical protein
MALGVNPARRKGTFAAPAAEAHPRATGGGVVGLALPPAIRLTTRPTVPMLSVQAARLKGCAAASLVPRP